MPARRRRRASSAPIPERFRNGFPTDTDENPLIWAADLAAFLNAHPEALDVGQALALMTTAPEPTEAQRAEAEARSRLRPPIGMATPPQL
ncbi:hypothetical protein [Kocuria sp. KH4]